MYAHTYKGSWCFGAINIVICKEIYKLTVSEPQAKVCSGEDDPLVAALYTHT